MKNLFVKVLVALLSFAPSLHVFGQYLVNNGKTDFKIVLSNAPKPVEQTAAKELKAHLDEITGINWVVAAEKDVPKNAPQILVGNSARARKFFPEVFKKQIPYDGIEIHLKKNKLLLTGHEQRGALYAVNTFLEEVLGVRWWTSTEQFVPTHKTFELKPINLSYAPKLFYREAFYKDAFAPVFAPRMKCNGHFAKIEPEYGNHHHITFWCHSFYHLIPPDKYFNAHPEWFSEIDGVRKHEYTQLCLTNDEMRKELTKNAIEELRKNPNSKIISISQNDWRGFCTCEKCKKVDEEEGSQSGTLIRFVNAVAEEIEKEFPDVYVETLAYQYTRKPPKFVKPRQNVIVRLCTIECSFVQPLTGEQNKTFYDDITGWSSIARQLYIWDYVTNFSSYILPQPNLRVLAPNIRFFVDNKAIGLFEQGDSYCAVGDFVRMRNWVISKLMWDQSLDENELKLEFLEGYYGKGATPFLLKYFDTLINQAESTGKHIGCYSANTSAWLDYETLCKATALFDEAIAAAGKESGKDSDFVRRLQRERLPLDHVWIEGYNKFKKYAETNGQKFMGPADPVEACNHFFSMLEKYEVIHYREGNSPQMFANFKNSMFDRFVKMAAMLEKFKNFGSTSSIEVQENEFLIVNVRGSEMIVDDPNASNGRAVKMPGNHNEWAAQIHIPLDELPTVNVGANTKFKLVAYVRCDATATDGLAMTTGIYNSTENKSVVQKELGVSEIAGSTYKKIEFEPVSINQSFYVWFAPPRRGREVQAVYIDRVIITKE